MTTELLMFCCIRGLRSRKPIGFRQWVVHLVCLLHVNQIKRAIGISGVETVEYAWRSSASKPGAQIDLLIDRKDGIINICEAKYTMAPFVIDADYEKVLRNKLNAFINETSCKKALHLTLLSVNGVSHNEYAGIVQNEITGEDLFA